MCQNWLSSFFYLKNVLGLKQVLRFFQVLNNCSLWTIDNTKFGGARIAKWYHTRLWSLVCCTMPWAMSSSLSYDNLFLDPSTTSTLSSWLYLVYLIRYYYLSVKFLMWKRDRKCLLLTIFLCTSILFVVDLSCLIIVWSIIGQCPEDFKEIKEVICKPDRLYDKSKGFEEPDASQSSNATNKYVPDFLSRA